jgi:hypothetical protein
MLGISTPPRPRRWRQAATPVQPALRRSGLVPVSHERIPRLALVVFVDHASSLWLRALRPGFRHCFVALLDGSLWLTCDPLKDRIQVSILPVSARFDLAAFYARQGHTVLLGTINPNLPRQPFTLAPLTCVTVAKRLLGVRAPWIATPWQLCRLLRSQAHGFVSVPPTEPTHGEHRTACRTDHISS